MPKTVKSRYQETYDRWISDPHGFWAEAARAIDWQALGQGA